MFFWREACYPFDASRYCFELPQWLVEEIVATLNPVKGIAELHDPP